MGVERAMLRGMNTQQLGVNVLFDFAVSTRLVFHSRAGRRRSRVVELGLVLCVRRRQVSVDGGSDGGAVLVVVGQRQVQQAGAGGQVDVLHVIHLGATHRAQLGRSGEVGLNHKR